MANFMDVCRSAVAFCVRARFRWLEFLGAILLLCGTLTAVHAGYERYDYDSVGRLIRVIDERGRITEIRYDGVGNILQVTNSEVGTQAPAILSVMPSVIRRGETKQVVIAGSHLTGVAVVTSAVGLDILDVRSTATQVTLKLIASNNAVLGQQSIQMSSAAGTATATITVVPLAPKLYVNPVPLAVPPDNIGRQIALRLSNADATDHTIGLAATNGNIAVAPAQVTIPAGQTNANVTITGKTAGQSGLNLTSATLGNTSVPVYVTGEFAGMGTSHAKALGVTIAEGTATAPPVSPVLSRMLGVVIGNFVSGMAPGSLVIGSGPTVLTVVGSGLNGAASVTLNPPTGITVGVPAPAADGRSLSVPLTVAADAPLGVRQVTVSDGAGNRFAVTHPQADRIEIVRPGPEIDSIDPLHALRGSVVTMTIRGRNLLGLQAETVPATGVTFGADPVLNAEGTEARVQLGVGVDASVGEYLVVAKTPGGSSSTTKTGSNTFRVVNELLSAVTPISSRPLGVVVHADASGTNNAIGLLARPLGVAVGSIIGAVW